MLITTTLYITIPPEPANAIVHGKIIGPIKSAINGIKNSILNVVNKSIGLINTAISEIKKLAVDVKDIVHQVGDKLYDFLKNMVQLIVGLNPSSLVNTLVYNEAVCNKLPEVLKNPEIHFGSQLKAIENKIPFLNLIQDKIGFSITDIALPNSVRGIDPKTATSRDLYEYGLYTVKPLSAISDMAIGPFKIPAVIGSSFSSFCAEATEFYLGEKGDDESLAADIHKDLSSGKKHKNAQYQLPNSAGGYLEDVSKVLASTITKYETLTMEIDHDVYEHLQKGQSYMNNGQFRRAYKAFQKSYKDLTSN